MAINEDTLNLAQGMEISLDNVVDSATRDLVRAWAYAWDDLAREWEVAIADLMAQSVDGSWPSQAVIARARRAARALDATRDALDVLAAYAGVRITEPLPQVAFDATQWETRITASQLPPGGVYTLQGAFGRVDPVALDAIVTRTSEQVTSTLVPLSATATARMNTALVRGVGLGINPRQAAREMLRGLESEFNGGLTRALVIARTEILDAHRAASFAQDQANAELLTGWQWMADLDRRTCPSCIAMHGTKHPITEPGPLDHQQGRCTRVPCTRSWKELGFDIIEPPSVMPDAQEWFDSLSVGEQSDILGPKRLDLLRAGDITWSDMTTRRSTDGWRDSYTVTPVKDLLKV